MTLSPSGHSAQVDTLHNNARHYAECRYAECHNLFTVMLSVTMLKVIMLIVAAPFLYHLTISFYSWPTLIAPLRFRDLERPVAEADPRRHPDVQLRAGAGRGRARRSCHPPGANVIKLDLFIAEDKAK